MKPAVAEW